MEKYVKGTNPFLQIYHTRAVSSGCSSTDVPVNIENEYLDLTLEIKKGRTVVAKYGWNKDNSPLDEGVYPIVIQDIGLFSYQLHESDFEEYSNSDKFDIVLSWTNNDGSDDAFNGDTQIELIEL